MSAELRALVREQAAAFPEASPPELAKHVAAATCDADLLGFYEETLGEYIAAMLRYTRNRSLDGVGEPVRTPKTSTSPKLRDIRDGFKQLCAERVHVGHSHWKTLGECTTDDLGFCIAEREQHIATVQGQIANYEKLVVLMQRHQVAKVSQLPPKAVFP